MQPAPFGTRSDITVRWEKIGSQAIKVPSGVGGYGTHTWGLGYVVNNHLPWTESYYYCGDEIETINPILGRGLDSCLEDRAPGLGYVVNHHGDRFRPLRIGLV